MELLSMTTYFWVSTAMGFMGVLLITSKDEYNFPVISLIFAPFALAAVIYGFYLLHAIAGMVDQLPGGPVKIGLSILYIGLLTLSWKRTR